MGRSQWTLLCGLAQLPRQRYRVPEGYILRSGVLHLSGLGNASESEGTLTPRSLISSPGNSPPWPAGLFLLLLTRFHAYREQLCHLLRQETNDLHLPWRRPALTSPSRIIGLVWKMAKLGGNGKSRQRWRPQDTPRNMLIMCSWWPLSQDMPQSARCFSHVGGEFYPNKEEIAQSKTFSIDKLLTTVFIYFFHLIF